MQVSAMARAHASHSALFRAERIHEETFARGTSQFPDRLAARPRRNNTVARIWNAVDDTLFSPHATEDTTMAETSRQKRIAGRVMHEFKHGELKSGRGGKGGKVKSRRQAIAIGTNPSGPSSW